MFGTIRKHSQALWIPIIIVIVISFGVYFTPGFDPLDNRGNQQSETDSQLKYARQQVLLEMGLQAQGLNSQPRLMQFIYRYGFIPAGFDASSFASQMKPYNLMGNDPKTQQKLDDLFWLFY